eukprot:TRINITY_DN27237_c0_g1_i1.p1 TRINITY_DN27237_c0_g1~~TRINITY_DN27237_c0_g1_i1.p1  ORF type:complete len:413 (-),score=75.78 TRINITY_DN27237_c0_g1_i1:64-1248(-)
MAFAASAAAVDFPYMAGLNVPWNKFGYDIGGGSFDASWFESYFSTAQSGGQNIARLWLHTDGARAGLQYGNDGTITGLSATFTDDLKQLLNLAQKHNVVVQLCLWSFDMCKDEMSMGSTKAAVISNETISKSYVANALQPMLQSVSDFPNLIVETINEPEWCMIGPGNTPDKVAPAEMQRFVGMIAEAAHAAGRKVTTGSASLKWSSFATEAEASYWDDASLQKAYTGTDVFMDFYNVHYYDWMHNAQWGYDPMRADVAHWKLNRPTVVAEIPPKSNYYSVDQMLSTSTSNGFKGTLFWAYNDRKFDVSPVLAPLQVYASDRGATYDAILAWLAAPTPGPEPPACEDKAPDSQYTCDQQSSWGKCKESFMAGWCCKTCFQCDRACGKSGAVLGV